MPRAPREGVPPERFAETTPPQAHPSGDYSYTVELVGSIQHQLGKLTEAVDSLKKQSTEHGTKLDDVRMDVHGAKSAAKALLWVVGVVGALLGLILAAYFRYLFGTGK